MGRTVKMQAAAAVIDQDNGGIEVLQKHLLVQVGEFERRLFFDSGLKREPGSPRETCYRRGDGPLSEVNPGASGDRLKRLLVFNVVGLA